MNKTTCIFYKFIEFAISNNPHYRIHVSTNGGIRNPDYWQKLAQLLSTCRGKSKKVYFRPKKKDFLRKLLYLFCVLE